MNNNDTQPSTATIEVRCSIKALAAVANRLKSKGLVIQTKGGIARIAIETYADLLIKQGLVPPVESSEEALDILASVGIDVRKNGRLKSSLVEELLQESEVLGSDLVSEVLREMSSLSDSEDEIL